MRWTTAEPARYRRVRFGSRAWRGSRAPRCAFRQTSFRCRIPSTQSYSDGRMEIRRKLGSDVRNVGFMGLLVLGRNLKTWLPSL